MTDRNPSPYKILRIGIVAAIGMGLVGIWQMNISLYGSLNDSTNAFLAGVPQQMITNEESTRLSKLESTVKDLLLHSQTAREDWEKREKSDNLKAEALQILIKDHDTVLETKKLLNGFQDQFEAKVKQSTESIIRPLMEQISEMKLEKILELKDRGLSGRRRLKVHFWDDTTPDSSPREDLLIAEGWLEYNGRSLGDDNEDSKELFPPWFVKTDDPKEADLIVWISTMSRHEKEVPPTDPIHHGRKVIMLDHADGCTVHQRRWIMQGNKTEIAYFKRSFVQRSKGVFKENCTRPDEGIIPYAYSGSKVMMIPYDSPEADTNFKVQLYHGASVYGNIEKTEKNANDIQSNDGYFKTKRYENFLVPFQDRKWTLTNVLKATDDLHNSVRVNIVNWTHEFSREQGGNPRIVKEGGSGTLKDVSTNSSNNDFTAYVGVIDKQCSGHCFGRHYLRHLRDAKIIVTCNPLAWEGDFRLWESFLSGALVIVDKMVIPEWMPNPPKHGKHWVVYDPKNKTDFMTKLRYYSDPANAALAQEIAANGYEFALKHHMAVNRVDYILQKIKDKFSG